MSDQDKGLYNKYIVINRETGKEAEGAYFVLQPDKDAAARPAILRYAEETENLKLSADLWKWISCIDAYAACPEDTFPLLDGTEVILSPGDRVLFQRSRPGAMPLTIDADSIIDDVLQAYKGTLIWLGQVSQLRDKWYSSYLEALADTDDRSDMISIQQGRIADLERELDESKQRNERLELYAKSLEFSRNSTQDMAGKLTKEKGLELHEAKQTIAIQQAAMKEAHKCLMQGSREYWAEAAEHLLSAALGVGHKKEPAFGTYAAHQPHYDSFVAHGRNQDYIYQALVHMGYATIEMSWANTVLSDMTDVPKEFINEMKTSTIQIDEYKERLRKDFSPDTEGGEQA